MACCQEYLDVLIPCIIWDTKRVIVDKIKLLSHTNVPDWSPCNSPFSFCALSSLDWHETFPQLFCEHGYSDGIS